MSADIAIIDNLLILGHPLMPRTTVELEKRKRGREQTGRPHT